MDKIVSQLIALLDQAFEAELAFVANLTDEQRHTVGNLDRWAYKDLLAHIAAWNAHEVDLLQAGVRRENPQLSNSLDEINAEIFEEHRGWSWEQVIRLLNDAHREMAAALAGLSAADLTDAERFPWTRGQPLLHRVAFTSYYHPLSHLARRLWDDGEREAGAQLEETTSLNMASLDESDHWQAVQRYNLGCFYALSDQQQAAMELVYQALVLAPDLVQWARQDEELASLRDDPAFIALTGSQDNENPDRAP